MIKFVSNSSTSDDDSQWLSVSDIMAGLMMVFLFIAVVLMRTAFIERDKIKQVAVAYQENQVAIYDALVDEFESDLDKWDATIDQDSLTFTFKSPDILFADGSSSLSDEYQRLLGDFFPRYVEVLLAFRPSINEVRIEGHTSSQWNAQTSYRDAYFLNMKLSQDRTRSVLDYLYDLSTSEADRPWIEKSFAAVGLSSSKRVFDSAGNEDFLRSRRVTFRVITNADIQMRQILESSQ